MKKKVSFLYFPRQMMITTLIVMMALLISSIVYIVNNPRITNYSKESDGTNKASDDIKENPDKQTTEITDDENKTAEVKYSIDIPKEFNSETNYNNEYYITVGTEQKFRDWQAENELGDTCVSICARFKEDKALFDKQFELINQSTECTYSDNYINAVENNFILDSAGIMWVLAIYGTQSDNLDVCGLKLITHEGYDAAIENYRYRTIFKKDNLITSLDFPLFPQSVFKESDDIYKNLGYDNELGSCDAVCSTKVSNYIDNFDADNPNIQAIIKKYDDIVATFKFEQ